MKKEILKILLLFFTISISGQTIYVKRVVDGDTFKDSTDMSYRFIGINAPEKNEIGGFESTKFLDSLINNKYIQIVTDNKYDTIDFYKRKLCYVFLNGTDINKLMIESEHAITYTKYPFSKMQEYLSVEKKISSNSEIQKNKSNFINDKNIFEFKNIKIITLSFILFLLVVIAYYYYYKK